MTTFHAKVAQQPSSVFRGRWNYILQAGIVALCSAIFNSVFFWKNTIGADTPIHVFAFFLSILAIYPPGLKVRPGVAVVLLLYVSVTLGLQFAGQPIAVLNRVSFPLLAAVIIYSWTPLHFAWYRRWLTSFAVLLVVGALFGELYAIAELPPIDIFENSDGSMIKLFGTTLATTRYGGAIRASGIYDEAGTFVFVIWTAILVRILSGKNDGYVMFLIIGGVFTFSFIHTILSVVYFIRYVKYLISWNKLVALLLLSGTATSILAPADLSDYFDRFRIENGRVVGDNRSDQIESFFKNIDIQVFFLGDPAVLTGSSRFDYSSNPFNPIVNNGVIVALPFYLLCMWLSGVTVFGRHKAEAVIFLLLLTQRPFLFSFGYSFMIVIVAGILLHRQKLRKRQSAWKEHNGDPVV